VYVDSLINRLELSKLGCWVGDCYIGCILYAGDIILISASIYELQNMINICCEEASKINMIINS